MKRLKNRLFGGWLRRRERAKHLQLTAWLAMGGDPDRCFLLMGSNRRYRSRMLGGRDV